MEEDFEAVVVEEFIKVFELVPVEELVLVSLVEALVVEVPEEAVEVLLVDEVDTEVLDTAFTNREKPPVLPVLLPSPE